MIATKSSFVSTVCVGRRLEPEALVDLVAADAAEVVALRARRTAARAPARAVSRFGASPGRSSE